MKKSVSPEKEIQEVKVNKFNQKEKEQKATIAINNSIDYLISVFEMQEKEKQKKSKNSTHVVSMFPSTNVIEEESSPIR